MLGQIIKHYRVSHLLGGGGMGVVFKAEDLQLGRTVALKFLPPEWSHEPLNRERFLREARAASALDHPNICSIHEIGEADDGRLFIVMSFYEGETLKHRLLRGGPIPAEKAVALTIQIARGLSKSHAENIVHRDIKPANLMITKEGLVKILDFGLAKIVSEASVTTPGDALGTLPYMSPEQARGDAIDHRADIWSLGVVLYEMLAGVRPFRGESSVVLEKIQEASAPALELPANEYSVALEGIVNRCLERDPERRFQSAGELVSALTRLEEGSFPDSDSFVETAWRSDRSAAVRTPRRKKIAIASALALALVTCGLIVLSFLRSPELTLLPLEYEGPEDAGYWSELIPRLVGEQLQTSTRLRPKAFSESRIHGARAEPALLLEQFGVHWTLKGRLAVRGDSLSLQLELWGEDGLAHGWPKTIEDELANITTVIVRVSKEVAESLGVSEARSDAAQNAYLDGRKYLEGWDLEENYLQAQRAFERAILEDDTFAEAYAALAQALWRRFRETGDAGLVERATREAQLAVTLAPTLPEAHLALGIVQLGKGNSVEAAESFERAQELAPADDAVCTRIGEAYAALNRIDEAESFFERAIELAPGHWENYNLKGSFYLETGRPEEAGEAFRRVIELRPESATGYANLALTQIMLGELAAAEPLLREAIRVSPSAEAHNNLGFVYYSTGRFAEAAEEFRNAAALGPEVAVYFLGLGDAFRRLGARAKAREAYSRAVRLAQQALEVNPDDAVTRGELAMALAGMERCAEASSEATLAERHPTPAPYASYILAVAAALCNDDETALTRLEQAVRGGMVIDVQTNPDLKRFLDHPTIQNSLR